MKAKSVVWVWLVDSAIAGLTTRYKVAVIVKGHEVFRLRKTQVRLFFLFVILKGIHRMQEQRNIVLKRLVGTKSRKRWLDVKRRQRGHSSWGMQQECVRTLQRKVSILGNRHETGKKQLNRTPIFTSQEKLTSKF